MVYFAIFAADRRVSATNVHVRQRGRPGHKQLFVVVRAAVAVADARRGIVAHAAAALRAPGTGQEAGTYLHRGRADGFGFDKDVRHFGIFRAHRPLDALNRVRDRA